MNCLNGTLHECFFVFKQSIAGRKLYTKYDVIIGDFVSRSAVYYAFNNCILGNWNEFCVCVFLYEAIIVYEMYVCLFFILLYLYYLRGE